MKSIKGIKNCYGCGVCAVSCSRGAITIHLNSDGFYTPLVDDIICTNCGICRDICSFTHDRTSLDNRPIKSYGAWSNTPNVRFRCSSGGVGYELGRYLIMNGYKVCGVRYNCDTHRAEHYVASNEAELMLSVGSKYIQSYTVDGFKAINKKDKYLVTGTPCQIDSFRRYIRKFKVEDNFVLMDFFCHSVPSMLAWEKYISIVQKDLGPIVYASWRNKYTGWHDSWAIAIDGNKSKFDSCTNTKSHNYFDLNVKETKHQYFSRFSQGDLFYKLFLGDYCCNPACQNNCKYKYDQSSADIRIGDFWGKTYKANEKGVSAVVAFTDKGNRIIKQIDCTIIEHPFEVVAEGQMKRNVGKAIMSFHILRALRNGNSTYSTFKIIMMINTIFTLPLRLITKIKKMIWERE